jgi:anti-sigma regulatory factor (Ser/Thr protein kinase)
MAEERRSRRFRPVPEDVGAAARFAARAASDLGLDIKRAARLEVAVEELVANVCRHARASLLSVSVRSVDGGVEVEMCDDGPEFDPTGHPESELVHDIEQRPIGGLGVLLVRHMVDGFDYRRDSGRNVVVLRMAQPR